MARCRRAGAETERAVRVNMMLLLNIVAYESYGRVLEVIRLKD
jgi:hypothetical protein